MLEWIRLNPAVAAGLFTLVGGFLTAVVWPMLSRLCGAVIARAAVRLSGRYFEQRYLEWIINEHEFLPLLPTTLVPVTGAHRHELDRLYVSLTMAKSKGQTVSSLTLGDVLRDHNRLVILGDPGAGKTTMLRFLALTFARARSKMPLNSRTPDRELTARRTRDARARVAKEFGLTHTPLPILVYLNRLRDVAAWPQGRSLLDFVRDDLKAVDGLRDFPVAFFDKKLAKGECVFLLDAFDELGTQEGRNAVAKLVGDVASAAPKGNRFIVTSRIVGYGGQLAQYGFSALTLERLSSELVRQLVRKWYDSLAEPTLADQLIETLRINHRLYELAANPMLLSLIVLVQYVKRVIPDRRHVLYDECVKILVERRYAPPHVQEMYNAVLPGDEAVSILQKMAYSMHLAKLREMPRMRMEQELIAGIIAEMSTTKAANVKPEATLKNIEQRSQLLVERGVNDEGDAVMAFSHLTFQEFLASAHLRERAIHDGELAVTEELIANYKANSRWWEEVALLYAAQLAGPQRAHLLQRLVPDASGSATVGLS